MNQIASGYFREGKYRTNLVVAYVGFRKFYVHLATSGARCAGSILGRGQVCGLAGFAVSLCDDSLQSWHDGEVDMINSKQARWTHLFQWRSSNFGTLTKAITSDCPNQYVSDRWSLWWWSYGRRWLWDVAARSKRFSETNLNWDFIVMFRRLWQLYAADLDLGLLTVLSRALWKWWHGRRRLWLGGWTWRRWRFLLQNWSGR